MTNKKIKLGVIFGGRSGEHEVSILSASSFIDAVDNEKYKVIPLGIDKQGEWHFVDPVRLSGITKLDEIVPDNIFIDFNKVGISELTKMIDFAFPLVHGRYGEDGTLQGVFETLDIPYAGCGVTSSAIGMDKVFAKMIWTDQGIPVVPYHVVSDPNDRYSGDLGFPVFVKPPNSGSSVGVRRVTSEANLADAIAEAFKYDTKVMVEQEVKGRELETAVMGNCWSDDELIVGAIGEIIPDSDFYDYNAKYADSTTTLLSNIDIGSNKEEELKELAKKAYCAIGGEGYARVDCFMEDGTGNIYVNEINTIPGFTKYSMFPILYEKQGLAYGDLIDIIVRCGYERKKYKK